MPYLVGYVTPQDYGAAGNGTTDDTTAVQAALTAVNAAGGGTLLLPMGTYKLSSALTGYANVALVGVGSGASVLNQTSTTANCLTYNTASGNLNYPSLSNLTIQGPGSGSGVGLLLEAASGSATVASASLAGVVVTGFGSHGIELVGGSGCTLDAVSVASVGGHCYYLNGGAGNALSGCVGAGGSTTQLGYLLSSASYTTLTGCKANGCGAGYQISGGASVSLVGCGADGIVAANGQNGDGFEVNGGTNHGLVGCYSHANAAVAFYVTGSASGVSLVGVQEASPSGGASASIKVDSGSTATVVNEAVATATSLASGTTTTLTGGALTLPGTMTGVPSSTSGVVLSSNVNGTQTFDPFRILGDGTQAWGPGTAARDTQITRSATGTLSLTNPVTSHGAVQIVDGNVVVGGTAALGDNGVGELALVDAPTAPTSNPTGGTVVYSASGTAIPVRMRDKNGSVRGLSPGAAVATTAQSITSKTTQTASTQLVVAVEASATYLVSGWLVFSQTAAGTATFAFTAPSGATMPWGAGGDGYTIQATPTTATGTWTTNTTGISVWFFGTLTTSSTAGSLTVTFAQGTSSANALSLAAGSTLILERVK